MDNIKQALNQLFAPLHAQLSPPRPDGSVVLSLLDQAGETVYNRVLTKAQLGDPDNLTQRFEEVRLELAVRSGNIPAELRKALKEQDSVLSYHID